MVSLDITEVRPEPKTGEVVYADGDSNQPRSALAAHCAARTAWAIAEAESPRVEVG